MESATHRLPVPIPRTVDPDPEQYDVINGKVYLKDDRLSYLDGFNADEYPIQLAPSYESPDAKHRGALRGYTGTVPHMGPVEDKWDDLYPPERIAIRGYSGFLPMTQNVYGEPLIPSIEAQVAARSPTRRRDTTSPSRYSSMNRESGHVPNRIEQSKLGSAMTHFRTAFSRDALEERYLKAVRQVERKGQTQQQLARIFQKKLAERTVSHSDQVIRAKKLFHYFDMNGNDALNEDEFRQLLELANVLFDDVQTLALFAFIDRDYRGAILWSDFEARVLVQDPKIGHYTVPKTNASPYSEHWKSMSLESK
jgi:hypothetical protein